jgi:Reverse transcriptase (RNA-dependent DNA polymerase)
MNEFNIDKNTIYVIKALYNKASSAVLLSNQIGECFRTSLGVRQGCILCPVLFNLFLEHIMKQTLHVFPPCLTVHGRPISNVRFADDIDLIGENFDHVQDLTSRYM